MKRTITFPVRIIEDIEHLIFDLDGTLIDSVEICVKIANDMLRDRGFAECATIAQGRELVSLGGVEMITALLGRATRNSIDDIAEFRLRYSDRPTPPQSLFRGVPETLSELSKQFKTLSICSNKPQKLCEKVLSDLCIGKFFSAVVGTKEGLKSKPDPHILEVTLDAISGARQSCVYIGDSEIDLALCERAKVPFVYASYGYGLNLVPEEVTRIGRFSDILDLEFAPSLA